MSRYYSATRRYKLKKTARNDFTAMTGIRAFTVNGGSNCIIVEYDTIRGMDCCRYAYIQYNDVRYKLSRNVHFKQLCGVMNCVKKEHLVAEYIPTKSDIDYINGYGTAMDDNELAHALNIPVGLLKR